MDNNEIYTKLKKDAQYALNSEILTLAYEVYGEAKMALLLNAITKEQFFELNDMVVTTGINNPSVRLE